jgi:hypothetical protein
MPHKRRFTRPAAALLCAALVTAPLQGAMRAGDGDRPADGLAADAAPWTIRTSALRVAADHAHLMTRQQEPAAAGGGSPSGTSVAEKLAAVYLLVGGSIMLVYGPTEKEGEVWTADGKSETVGGAAAIGLSIALFHDIWKRRTPPAAGGR